MFIYFYYKIIPDSLNNIGTKTKLEKILFSTHFAR